jgi:hypothetical protein
MKRLYWYDAGADSWPVVLVDPSLEVDMGAKKKVTVIFVGDDSRAPVPQNMLKEDVVPYLENWWVKKPMRKGLVVPSFWNAYKWSLKILQETAPDDFSCFPPSVLSHYRIDMIGSLASAPTKTGNFFPEKKRKRVHDAGASGTQGAGQSNDSATKRKKSSTTESDVQNCNAKKRGRLSAENGAAQEEASKSTNDPVAKEGDDRRFSNGSRFLSERGADLQFPIEACVCNISYNLVKGVYAAKPTDSIKRRVEFSALKKWRRHGFRNKLSWKKLPLGTFANMTYASRGRDLAVYLLDQIFNVADTDRGNDIYAIENFEECIEQFPPRYFDCTKFLGLGTRDQTDSYFVKLVRYAVLWTDKVANKDSQLFTHFSKQSLKTLVKDQEQLKKLCTKLHHEFCQRNLSSRGLWLLVQYAKWFGSSFRRKVNSEMKGRGVDVNLSVYKNKLNGSVAGAFGKSIPTPPSYPPAPPTAPPPAKENGKVPPNAPKPPRYPPPAPATMPPPVKAVNSPKPSSYPPAPSVAPPQKKKKVKAVSPPRPPYYLTLPTAVLPGALPMTKPGVSATRTKPVGVIFEASDITRVAVAPGNTSDVVPCKTKHGSVASPGARRKPMKQMKSSAKPIKKKAKKPEKLEEVDPNIPTKCIPCSMSISIEDTEQIKRTKSRKHSPLLKSNIKNGRGKRNRRRISFAPEPYLELKRLENRPPRVTWTASVLHPYTANEDGVRPRFVDKDIQKNKSKDGREVYSYKGLYYDSNNGDLVVYRGQVHQTKTFIKERYNPAIGETRQGLTITPGETVLVLQKDKDFWLGKNSSGSFGWFPASCVTELQDAVDESESSSVEGKPPQSFATDGSVDTDLLRPPNKVRVRKSYFENILDMEFKALPRRNHQANEVPAVFLEPEQVQIA